MPAREVFCIRFEIGCTIHKNAVNMSSESMIKKIYNI